jgi:uncharacterized protein Yka (UPF0111/DUF47 family)
MLSLKRLLRREDRVYDLLESGAEEARRSVELFAAYLQRLSLGGALESPDEFMVTRRNGHGQRDEIVEELTGRYDAQIGREDVEELSAALHRISKQVGKIIERISIYPGRVPHQALRRQLDFMEQAVAALEFIVKQLRTGNHRESVREANERLRAAESEADKVMHELLKDLYHGHYDAKELLILQELYEMVERAVDRCNRAGEIAVRIALKRL